MPKIWPAFVRHSPTVPMPFVGIDSISCLVLFVVVLNAVENKELRLRTKVGHVSDTRALKIAFGAHGDGPWIKCITLPRNWIDGIRYDTQRRFRAKRFHPESIGVRHHQHVRFVNRSPTANGRGVKAKTIFE